MKKWENPDVLILNVNKTAMKGKEFKWADRRYIGSDGYAHQDFGEYTSSGKPVPEGGVTWFE